MTLGSFLTNNFSAHINHLTRSCYCQLRQLCTVSRSLFRPLYAWHKNYVTLFRSLFYHGALHSSSGGELLDPPCKYVDHILGCCVEPIAIRWNCYMPLFFKLLKADLYHCGWTGAPDMMSGFQVGFLRGHYITFQNEWMNGDHAFVELIHAVPEWRIDLACSVNIRITFLLEKKKSRRLKPTSRGGLENKVIVTSLSLSLHTECPLGPINLAPRGSNWSQDLLFLNSCIWPLNCRLIFLSALWSWCTFYSWVC